MRGVQSWLLALSKALRIERYQAIDGCLHVSVFPRKSRKLLSASDVEKWWSSPSWGGDVVTAELKDGTVTRILDEYGDCTLALEAIAGSLRDRSREQ